MTAQDVINFAAKEANIMASGETLNSDEYADCLSALNAMLAAWNVEEITVYTIVNFSHALTANTGTYTIGPAGTFNTTRPTKIKAASVTQSNGVGGPLKIIDVEEWNEITEKSLTGIQPKVLYCDYNYPLATLYVHPRSSTTPTLDLWMWEELTGFANLTDTFDLPPGYLEAVWYNLAVHLAVMFGKAVSDDLRSLAQARKSAIGGLNVANGLAQPTTIPPQQPQR